MKGINKVILLGTVDSVVETVSSPSQTACAKFKLRVLSGEKEPVVIGVVCFGRLAEICQSYLEVGRNVYLEGKLRDDSVVVIDTIQILSPARPVRARTVPLE